MFAMIDQLMAEVSWETIRALADSINYTIVDQ